MSQFNVSLLTDIEVSGSLSFPALSSNLAETQARLMHSRAQVRWEYQGQPIGAYIGPLHRIWALDSGSNQFQVSLTAHIHIGATAMNVEAGNEREAIIQTGEAHAIGALQWSFGDVKLQYTGPFTNIWAIPS